MECVVRVSSRWWGASLGPTLRTAARETSCIEESCSRLKTCRGRVCDETGEDSCDVVLCVPFAGYTSQPNEPLGTFASRGCRAESRV